MELLKISTGLTGKLKGIDAISVSSNNPICDALAELPGSVCSHCYAKTYEKFRPVVRKAYEHNLRVLTERVIPLDELPRLTARKLADGTDAPFRLNSFGEIQDSTHIENYLNIARVNPDVRFALWTKRAVAEWFKDVPDNLVLVYSALHLNTIPPTPGYFNHTFVVYEREEDIPDYMAWCHGKRCIDCQVCYRKDSPHFIAELLK